MVQEVRNKLHEHYLSILAYMLSSNVLLKQVSVLQMWSHKMENSAGLPSPITDRPELDLLCFKQKIYYQFIVCFTL